MASSGVGYGGHELRWRRAGLRRRSPRRSSSAPANRPTPQHRSSGYLGLAGQQPLHDSPHEGVRRLPAHLPEATIAGMGSRHRRVPPPIILICPNPPTSADGGPAGLNARKNNSHRKMLGLYLHLRRTAVHRSSTRGCLGEPTPAVHTRKTAAQRAHHLGFITETAPPTYALRCTGLHHPIYTDSKATRNEKHQVTGYVTWGFSEPPSGFEPETYALRGPARSSRVVPEDAAESRFR